MLFSQSYYTPNKKDTRKDDMDSSLWKDNFDFTYELHQHDTSCVVSREMWPYCDIDTLKLLMYLLDKLPSGYQYLVRGGAPYLLFTHQNMMAYIRALWRARKYWLTSIDYALEIRAYPPDIEIPVEEDAITSMVAERTALFEVFTSMENDLFTFHEGVCSLSPLSCQTVADWVRVFAEENNKKFLDDSLKLE